MGSWKFHYVDYDPLGFVKTSLQTLQTGVINHAKKMLKINPLWMDLRAKSGKTAQSMH